MTAKSRRRTSDLRLNYPYCQREAEVVFIELRVVCEQPLKSSQECNLEDALAEALGEPYRFSIRYHGEILRHANGKYERFIYQV